jgi:hypothetical protein
VVQGSKAKLVARIRTVLSEPITEANVTALLAYVRKLRGAIYGNAKKHQLLKFYCDWVLHTAMSGEGVAILLKGFDEAWDRWITSGIPMPSDFGETLGKQIGFYGFEQELIELLGANSIAMPPVNARASWAPFEQVYCDLVEDSWLEYPKDREQLKHINAATVRKFKMSEHPTEKAHYAPGDYLDFGVEWTFMLGSHPVFRFVITFPSQSLLEREKRQAETDTPRETEER